MTVFITHFLKNTARRGLARFLFGLCVGVFLAPGLCAAATTEFAQLRVERADDGVYLSAIVPFDMPPVVEDALLKGISVYFVLEADLYRDRWYWTNPRVASAARTLRLAYQPLTGRWRVNIVSGLITSSSGLRATLNQNYETMAEALSAIQRIARWKIAEATEVDPDAAYTLDLNFRLDLSQLPRPFQIGMAGQRDWTISAQFKDRLRLAPVSGTENGK
ncbi:MAG: putative proline rich signal peptide protein [Polaromonas sp.]|nr:putative proline rich signal peptide protein [Polaromonas sp.]